MTVILSVNSELKRSKEAYHEVKFATDHRESKIIYRPRYRREA